MATALATASYVSFASLRRNGNWVATPVWFAPDGDNYYIFSAGNAGKVKRVRNFRQCRVAPCTATGKVTGDWCEGEAWLVDDATEQATAHRALLRKYGWQMRLLDIGSRLGGRYDKRRFIGFTIEQAG